MLGTTKTMAITNPEHSAYTTDEARWKAIQDRDPSADGAFFYCVKTTGVYCRPVCNARGPLRKNVLFKNTETEAQAAGFRPCKRCKPNEPTNRNQQLEAVERACRLLENQETMPTLTELAEKAGFSPYHFHRLFKRHTGVTPKAYGQAHRSKKMKQELRQQSKVTDAIYEAGYQNSSRFYEESQRRLGMTPSQFKSGAQGQVIRYTVAHCHLGAMAIAATHKGICFIHFGEGADALKATVAQHFPNATLTEDDGPFNQWVREVTDAVSQGRMPDRNLPLDIRGTAFQQKVWQALRDIPNGKTATYSEVAQSIGKPKAARAVARACASNNLAVAIPCHRVIRADGDLSGYRWGTERKRALLERESKS